MMANNHGPALTTLLGALADIERARTAIGSAEAEYDRARRSVADREVALGEAEAEAALTDSTDAESSAAAARALAGQREALVTLEARVAGLRRKLAAMLDGLPALRQAAKDELSSWSRAQRDQATDRYTSALAPFKAAALRTVAVCGALGLTTEASRVRDVSVPLFDVPNGEFRIHHPLKGLSAEDEAFVNDLEARRREYLEALNSVERERRQGV